MISHPTTITADKIARSQAKPPRLSLRTRILALSLIWIVALFPFAMLRRTTWFGRPLSDQQIGEYLHADEKPRQIEYALGQIGQRLARHDQSVSIWYADLVRLSTHSIEEVRALDATVMGEAAAIPDIHAALLNQLEDESGRVRFNAAISLAQVGDASGRTAILFDLKNSVEANDQTLEALAALQRVGLEEDLPIVRFYELQRPSIQDRVREQALATESAIRARSK